MVAGYTVRNLRIEPGLVLSPMSGVTTMAFRRLIKEFNPGAVGLLVSEFISVEAMSRRVPRSMAMMAYHPSERPFGIQIFGYDIDRMRDAALMVQDAGADLVDINCGCPAPKVVRKGGGCELMRQPDHLKEIIRAVRSAVSIPLTVKIRAGWDANSLNALEIAKMAEGEGIDALAIHGRTRAQMYRGEADWDLVGRIATQLKIPVLGSGDVVSPASAASRLSSGASGLFIGRAAISNPLVFTEVLIGQAGLLKSKPGTVISMLERYMQLLQEEFRPTQSIGKFKQLVSQMCRGYEWRKQLCTALQLEAQIDLLKKIREEFEAGIAGHAPLHQDDEPGEDPGQLDCQSYQ